MALVLGLGGISGVIIEMMLFVIPVWTAFLVGVLVGWSWRPRWARLDRNKFDYLVSKIVDFSAPSSPSKALADVSLPSEGFASTQSLSSKPPSCNIMVEDGKTLRNDAVPSGTKNDVANCSSLLLEDESSPVVNEHDLRYLSKLVEVRDGGPSWIQMMDRSTPTMSYRAWRRDVEGSPPQYRSSTIFEDATPEMVRDFFWDDDFRLKWDDMLIHANTVEECPTVGTMVVRWVRKFPFFCSDREYIIGRRIWDCGRNYYCVTKGVPCSSVPRQDKPRRVDLYYSSWCIRPVESPKRGNGEMTACEVLLFHYEDMGIPWEIAKFGVSQGMWGAVKKIEPGLRRYQKARASGEPLSRQAFMAQINTKVSPDYLRSLLSDNADGSYEKQEPVAVPEKKKNGMNIPKILIFGGAVALACSLDRGLLTKAVIFGVARRFGRIGGKF